MLLSPHFSLREMTRSATAARHGLDNTPPITCEGNLRALCLHVLEPVREHFAAPVRISSGYRCVMLNTLVRGAPDSQHVFGEAADLEVDGVSNLDVARWIAGSGVPFDQLILELWDGVDPHSGWVHVSHRITGARRDVRSWVRGQRMAVGLP